MEYVIVSLSKGVINVEKVTQNVTVEVRDYDTAAEPDIMTVDEHGMTMVVHIVKKEDPRGPKCFDCKYDSCGRCGKSYPINTMKHIKTEYGNDPELNLPDQYLCKICDEQICAEKDL